MTACRNGTRSTEEMQSISECDTVMETTETYMILPVSS